MKKFYLFISQWNSSINLLHGLIPDNRKQAFKQSLNPVLRVVGLIFVFIFLSSIAFSQGFTANGKLMYKDTMSLGERVAPTFADVDKDGDYDLYVGTNDGKITIFLNDGNGNFEADGYMQYNSGQTYFGMNPHPAFADIDGDNDLDIYDGYYSNGIIVYEQTSPGVFEDQGYLQVAGSVFSVGYNTTPYFVDLNRDYDYDLAVGDANGVVHICYNDGNGNFIIHETLEADDAYIDVGDNSAPAFGDVDGDGDIDIFVGNGDGNVEVFLNYGNNIFKSEGYFTADDVTVDVGTFAKPTFASIDDVPGLDLYIGSQDTTIYVFLNDGSGNFTSGGMLREVAGEIYMTEFGQSSESAFGDIDEDGDLDLYIGNDEGYINVFINEGTGIFTNGGKLQADGSNMKIVGFSSPTFADLDDDDDLDLYVGCMTGNISMYINNGSGVFSDAGYFQADGGNLNVGGSAKPTFADLDNDDDLDLYVGKNDGYIKVYLNNGSGVFSNTTNFQAGGAELKVDSKSSPVFIDIDDDNDLDLYVGDGEGFISVYTNDGTGTFSFADTLQADGVNIDLDINVTPTFANLDGSCISTLYVGNWVGRIYEFRGIDITSPVITSEWTEFDAPGNENCEASLFNYASILAVTDNCDSELDKVQTPSFGSTLTYGDNPVKIVVTDDAGNSDSISFNVIVYDNIEPVITSTHDNRHYYSGTSCGITLPDYTTDVIATDNCDSDLDITQSPVGGTIIEGLVNTITITATDDAGNYDEVTFNVEVEDNISPVITSTHSNVTVAADAYCGATLPDYTGDVTATDNCDDDLDVTQSPAIGSPISGTTNLITLRATDDSGNSDEITFNVEVVDETDPDISCSADATVTAGSDGNYTVSGNEYDATATDNCYAIVTNDLNSNNTLVWETLNVGTHTIVWTAIDGGGNTATCTTVITVQAGSTGFEDLLEYGISIYPNPISHKLNIELADPAEVSEIRLFDVSGRQLYINSEFINTKTSIDVSEFEPGLYLIQIKTVNKTFSKKIIKE